MNSRENSLNKRTILLGAAAIAALLILAAGCSVLSTGSRAKPTDIEKTSATADKSQDIVARIDGEPVTKKGFDSYKLSLNSGVESKLSDEQILDKIVERQVVYNQAIKEGMTASESEVDSAVKAAQEAIESESKQYEAFKDYISGLNLTEEAYWESVRPAYKKALTCGKYKNSLKAKFNEDNKEKAIHDLNAEFSKFYDEKVKALVEKAKVESFLK